MPILEEMKQMADKQATLLIDKLKSDPNNPDPLTSIGNVYYDVQQYPIAVDYYGRALKARPSDSAVRTDMATAYWYMGNADEALTEFDKALSYAPNNPNTLFSRDLVKWQGKKDGAGVVADWEKLLATDPNYAAKEKVEQMIADVKSENQSSRDRRPTRACLTIGFERVRLQDRFRLWMRSGPKLLSELPLLQKLHRV